MRQVTSRVAPGASSRVRPEGGHPFLLAQKLTRDARIKPGSLCCVRVVTCGALAGCYGCTVSIRRTVVWWPESSAATIVRRTGTDVPAGSALIAVSAAAGSGDVSG